MGVSCVVVVARVRFGRGPFVGGVPCAVRKVGHSPPLVGSFLGVGLPQGTIAIVYPCSINPPPSCVYVPLQTGTLRPVYGDTFSGCLHFSQFMLRRQKRYQPYGPWKHIPSSIWVEEEAPEVDEEEEDTFLCQVCGKRDTLECSTCDLYLCRGCMGEHTCDIDVPE